MKLFRKTVAVTAAIALAGTMLAFSPKANAATVTPTNLNGITLGGSVAGPLTSVFKGYDASTATVVTFADMTGQVFDNSGIYTYRFTVTPADGTGGTFQEEHVKKFNTNFSVEGFTGVAGWDYTQPPSYGGPSGSGGFAVTQLSNGTRYWIAAPTGTNAQAEWWNAADPVTFFFQSTKAPAGPGSYGLADNINGSALNYSVVPTPASALLAVPALALLGLGYMIRRRNQQLV